MKPLQDTKGKLLEKIVARLAIEVMECSTQPGKDSYLDGHVHGLRRAIYLINHEFRSKPDTTNEKLQKNIDKIRSQSDWEDYEDEIRYYLPTLQANRVMGKIQSLLAQEREEAQKEIKDKCKRIYVDNVDWSEWGISDEEAADNFEDHFDSLVELPESEEK